MEKVVTEVFEDLIRLAVLVLIGFLILDVIFLVLELLGVEVSKRFGNFLATLIGTMMAAVYSRISAFANKTKKE